MSDAEFLEEVEIVFFNDKSWVRFSEYMELKTEIKDLKAQIEKMKNCDNCKHKMIIRMADILEEEIEKDPCKSCNDLDKWEIKE